MCNEPGDRARTAAGRLRLCASAVEGRGAVVPGGIGGRRVAAKRGHDVVLIQRSDSVGGQMKLWSALPGRETFATTPRRFERQLQQPAST